MLARASAADGVERVVGVRTRGSGQQYEVKWHGQEETTWEAASRVRKQIPQLVQEFEQRQAQQQQQQRTSNEGVPRLDVEVVGAPGDNDNSALLDEMAALRQIVRTQQQRLQEMDLRASSPQHSPQLSPQQSPRQASLPAAAAQESRFARKEPRAQDLREYDGASGAKLDEWLDELGAAVDLFRLNDREAADFGTSRLRGAARQWWNALGAGRASVDSAGALGKALRVRFQPVTTERVAREQLRALRQGSRGINDYIADFQRLRALLPDMSEADAVFAFESGLSPALALELRKQGSAKLSDALSLAARIGGLTAAAAAAPSGRAAAAVNQMAFDDEDGAPMEERITRAVLNAMQSQQAQGASSAGLGAKTQTHRGYLSERGRGGAAARGGRGGNAGSRFGNRGPPEVPGVPAEVIQQRWTDKVCLRCGTAGHNSHACPNAISASRSSN